MVSLVLIFLSVFCASIPMLFFLAFIWWLDRYDREPIWLVAITFLWGAVGGVGVSLIGSNISQLFLGLVAGPAVASVMSPIVIAPLIEEPAKALILFLVCRTKHFDNTTDGFVYGAAAGLGFGMTENFMYFTGIAMSGSVVAWMTNVLIRTFFSALMHATATGLVGAAIGWSRWRRLPIHVGTVILGFGLAMGIHAMWNGLLVLDQFTSIPTALLSFALFPLEAMTIGALFLICVSSESQLIRKHLAAESVNGTLQKEHVPILASTWKRNRGGWLPLGVDQEDYVQTATMLAFRIEQAATAPQKLRASYREDVKRLRIKLSAMASAPSTIS
jgi:RsiW-degrading membrane proteinase PrsW (M82 family)